MFEWLYVFLLGQTILVGGVTVVLGLFGIKPKGWLVLGLVSVEIGLLVQLAASVGVVFAGQQAVVSTLEFFGYLLVALLLPPASFVWALAEPNRWATVVMGFTSLTVSVMLVRMYQIWTGIPFGS